MISVEWMCISMILETGEGFSALGLISGLFYLYLGKGVCIMLEVCE